MTRARDLADGADKDIAGTLTLDDIVLSNDMSVADNGKVQFGAGNDLQIYHTGGASYVQDNGSGNLVIDTNGAGTYLMHGSEIMASFVADGAVGLRHDNSEKLATTSTGVDITGGFTATDGCTITTADNLPQLTLKSTDADGGRGPELLLTRDSASPADGDGIGFISWTADNDAGAEHAFCGIEVLATDVSDGSEDATWQLFTQVAGTSRSRFSATPTETVLNEDSVDVDFRVESNGNTNMLFVDAGNDRIGVGTSAPSQLFDATATGSTTSVILAQNTTSNDGAAHLRAKNPQNELIIGTDNHSGGLTGTANASFLYTSSTTPIVIMPNGSEKVRITSGGNVGIGTSAPTELLHLNANNPEFTMQAATDGGECAIYFKDDDGNKDGRITYRTDYSGQTDNFMSFFTNNSEKMRIDSSGNVGIGNSSPSHLLDATVSSGSATARFGTTYAIGDNDGTVIISNGGSGDAMLRFDYEGSTDRARIGVTSSGQDLKFFTAGNNQRMIIKSDGKVGVGVNGPNSPLHVEGSSTNDNLGSFVVYNLNTANNACVAAFATGATSTSTSNVLLRFGSNNYASGQGMITAAGAGAAAFGTFSDRSLKENIADLPSQLANIMALRPVEFDYIESEGGGHQIGFIAQEVETVYPDLVGENDDGIKMLAGFDRTTARLVKALQEAIAKIEALETKVAALENA